MSCRRSSSARLGRSQKEKGSFVVRERGRGGGGREEGEGEAVVDGGEE